MNKPRDWICSSCNHLNFYWRQACRRCKDPRPQGTNTTNAPAGPRVITFRPGDWVCDAGICHAHNFASRRYCFKCGTLKSIPAFGVGFGLGYYNPGVITFGIPGGISTRFCQQWKPGDWFCTRPDCNAHNYAARVVCFKCKTSRAAVNASN